MGRGTLGGTEERHIWERALVRERGSPGRARWEEGGVWCGWGSCSFCSPRAGISKSDPLRPLRSPSPPPGDLPGGTRFLPLYGVVFAN